MDVKVDFMGVLADVTQTKKLALDFDEVPTLRELLDNLESRYGSEFATRVYRNAEVPRRLQRATRIFINGKITDDRALEDLLPESSAEVLVYFLPACCGG